jgi:hypothetical protein
MESQRKKFANKNGPPAPLAALSQSGHKHIKNVETNK